MSKSNKEKLNVGIFTFDFYPLIGGQGRHIYELYKQNEINQLVNLYVFSPTRNNLNHHVTIFPEAARSKLQNIEFSLKLDASINSIIGEYSLDVAHIHSGPGGLFLFRKLKVPTIFTSHHTYWQQSHYIKGQKWKLLLYYVERLGYSRADKVICVSPDTQAVLFRRYKIDPSRLLVIPNGIPCKPVQIADHFGRGQEILYVGRIDKRKGVDFLIEAFEELNKTNPKVTLHIAGEGKDRKKLENYCRRKGLNIVFHGFLSDADLDDLYKQVSVQIVPSIFEGFGLVVLEAMSKGIPVIATNVDGIRGIIEDGWNGILVTFGDRISLAREIQRILVNKEIAIALVKNASGDFNQI